MSLLRSKDRKQKTGRAFYTYLRFFKALESGPCRIFFAGGGSCTVWLTGGDDEDTEFEGEDVEADVDAWHGFARDDNEARAAAIPLKWKHTKLETKNKLITRVRNKTK